MTENVMLVEHSVFHRGEILELMHLREEKTT